LSKNVTLPVAAALLTVAVKVTDCPILMVGSEDTTVVVVRDCTFCVSAPVLPAKVALLSEYVAVML
jgi:hypothetical protein